MNINGLAAAGYVRGMEYRHTLIVTIDGVKVFEGQIGGEDDIKAIDQQQASAVAAINGRFQNIPVKVTAGPHKVGVTFIARTFAESDEVLFSFRPGAGEERIQRVGSIEIQGPFTAAGLSDTPSRQRIFVCRPTSDGRRAPVRDAHSVDDRAAGVPSSGDRSGSAAPLSFYKSGAGPRATFDAGIQAALPAILASPKFLYRAERTPPGTAPGAVHRITATRSRVAPVVLPARSPPGR